jgi:PAS domain S-box-containing protein
MPPQPAFPALAGASAARLRAFDWTRTPLGAMDAWPVPLRTLVTLMCASNQPMFIAWGPQRTLLYNDPYAEILGAKHPGALGQDFLNVWEEIRPDLQSIVDQAYRGEPVAMDRIKLVMHRHGYAEETYFSFFYAPVHDADGSVGGLFCACTEITGQVVAQRELLESEARYRDVLSRMDEAFFVLDENFRVLEVNQEALRIDTRPREAIIGRTMWELHPGSEEAELGAFYKRVMGTRQAETREQDYTWADGRITSLEIRAYPVADGIAVFFKDVTQRRATERDAARAAERMQLALDAGAIVGTWVWDVPQDRFVADERFARSFGLPVEQCLGGLPLDAVTASIHPDDLASVMQLVQEAMARGGPYRAEYRVRQQDGSYRWIEANGRVELDASGKAVRFPGVLLDIEERRRVEAERDQANALLRAFIEAVPGVVYAKDRDGRMLVANRGTAELVGKPPEFFIGKTDAEFLQDPQEAAAVMATDRRIMQSGQAEQVEEQVRLADGTAAWWLSTKAPMRDAEGRVIGLIGSSVDITERKRQQETARTEAEMLDLLNQTGTLLAAELDLQILLQSVTDAATRLTGARFGAFFYNGLDEAGEAYTLYTLSGAPREAFDKFGHPRPTPIFEQTFRGGPPLRIHDVLADPRYGKWAPHHGMPRNHLPVRSYLAVSVLSRGGEPIGGLFFGHPEPGVFTERSERLASGIAAQAAVAIDNARLYAEAHRSAAERERLLESERSARTEAERASTLKDEFLATLSHELRTPLSSILGWVHILRGKRAAGEDTVQKGVTVIERNARVQLQLVDDLLDMSRITSGKLRLDAEPLSPIGFVSAALDTVRPTAAAASVQLDLEVEGDVPLVLGDAARLQQVVWNLLANAIKFTPAGGRVLVRVGSVDGQARIAVRDSGVGIAPEFLPHVFDRFRQADGSTTRRFGGLGLGLSIVRRLVEMHGGSVSVASDGQGRGAEFSILLPAHAIASPDQPVLPEGAREHADPRDVDLHGIKVLVVDDEPDVLDLLSRLLGERNADVEVARSAVEALASAQRFGPAVLVSDIGMPETDGYELLRRLRKQGAAAGEERLPAIALTAFARPEDRQRALDSGFDRYLTKPVDPQTLVSCIVALAAAPRGSS